MIAHSHDARRTLVLAASISLVLAGARVAEAREIPYPGATPGAIVSLQAAVDAAAPGDTVLIAMGRYVENVKLKNGVSLRSASGPDSTILVSPGGAPSLDLERLVHCPPGIDSTTVIEGLTLEDGGFSGMGIYCEKSSPVIRGNVLRGFGWGIKAEESTSLIEGNIVEACKTFPVTILAAQPRLYRNEIRNNFSAGIDVSGRKSHPVIGGSKENANRIYGNQKAFRNGSRNDIDATWNDWGWETTEEMNAEGYPSDIIAIIDGNDFSKTHRGRGKVNYQHWIQADPAAAKTAVASAPAKDAAASSASSSDSAGATNAAAAPSSSTPARIPPAVPIGAAAVLIIIFVARARRRSSAPK